MSRWYRDCSVSVCLFVYCFGELDDHYEYAIVLKWYFVTFVFQAAWHVKNYGYVEYTEVLCQSLVYVDSFTCTGLRGSHQDLHHELKVRHFRGLWEFNQCIGLKDTLCIGCGLL